MNSIDYWLDRPILLATLLTIVFALFYFIYKALT